MNRLHRARRFVVALLLLATLAPLGMVSVVSAGVAGPDADSWRGQIRAQDDDDDDDWDDDDVYPAPAPLPSPPAQADDDDDDDDDVEVVIEIDDDEHRGRRSGRIIDDDGDPGTDGYYAGEAIVHLVAGASITSVNERHNTVTIASIDRRDLYLLELPADADAERLAADLAADDDLAWAELNYVSQAPEGRPQYFFTSGEATGADPGEQYALDLLGVAEAHACTTGGGVTVAVLDTGVDATHEALQGRVLTRGLNVFTGTNDTADTGNDRDDDADGMIDEMVGHGTHVAGIIAQVAPGATILPITTLSSDGVGDAFFLAAGIYAAVDYGVDVINLSLSSTVDARIVADAVAHAADEGIVLVAAAGNAGRELPPEHPAAAPDVFGVAATDERDRKSDFSNYGDTVTIAAPGEAILSALPGDRTAAWGGTSMATAFVSAAAALLLAADAGHSHDRVHDLITDTAHDISAANPEYADKLGHGRLNIAPAACA